MICKLLIHITICIFFLSLSNIFFQAHDIDMLLPYTQPIFYVTTILSELYCTHGQLVECAMLIPHLS